MRLPGIHQIARGRMAWEVLDAQGRILSKSKGWIPNLILNQGMAQVGLDLWCNTFLVAGAGTAGASNTRNETGSIQVSQAGTALTADSPFFVNPDDVGSVLKWDSGEEAYISSVTTDTTAVALDNKTKALGHVTLYKTNQTDCQNRVQNLNRLTSSPLYNYSLRAGNVFTHHRTYEAQIVSAQTFREFSFGWGFSDGQWLCRVSFPDGVYVPDLGYLRLLYELELTIVFNSSRYIEENRIGGWPSCYYHDALQELQISVVDPTVGGTALYAGSYYGLEPCYANSAPVWLYTLPATLNGLGINPTIPGSGTTYTMTSLERINYPGPAAVPSSTGVPYWYCDKVASCLSSECITSQLRTIGWGSTGSCGYCMVFDADQNKPGTHGLRLLWRYSWSRTLNV